MIWANTAPGRMGDQPSPLRLTILLLYHSLNAGKTIVTPPSIRIKKFRRRAFKGGFAFHHSFTFINFAGTLSTSQTLFSDK
jgi:hypothetical protein